MTVIPLDEGHSLWRDLHLPGIVFTPLKDNHLEPHCPARGRQNFGYAFFETELTARALQNSCRYDLVFAASSWGLEGMRMKGIQNSALLIQGIDGQIFYQRPLPERNDRFVIFSGGKLELRKGQDLVLKVFRILQDKYQDMVLMTAWYNHWPESVATMAASPHLRWEALTGAWISQMQRLYCNNGIDPKLLPYHKMAQIYAESHLGLFPNRCEGGTNLVLMEFMATGRPAIASYATGHRDLLNESNALLLRDLAPCELLQPSEGSRTCWVEPSLDEIVAQVEFAYTHWKEMQLIAQQAAKDMAIRTWAATAQSLWSRLDVGS
jgi:glycosyltransferase involved in cell wall biosynthesis